MTDETIVTIERKSPRDRVITVEGGTVDFSIGSLTIRLPAGTYSLMGDAPILQSSKEGQTND